MLKTELGHKKKVTQILHIIIIIRNRVGEKIHYCNKSITTKMRKSLEINLTRKVLVNKTISFYSGT